MGRFTDHSRVEKNRAHQKQDDFNIRGMSPARGGTSDRARGGGYNRGRGRVHDFGRGDHESSRGGHNSGRGGFDNSNNNNNNNNNRGGSFDNSRSGFYERGRGGRGRGRGRGGYREYDHHDESTHDSRKGMVKIIVSGILDSAVADEPDRGLSKCREWLQERANFGYKQPRDYVQFKFPRFEGDNLVFEVRKSDAWRVIRSDGQEFFMTSLSVKRDDDEGRGRGVTMVPAVDAVERTEIFKAVLADRYDAESKMLKLNDLGSDIRLNKIGTWDPSATRRKGTDFFQGLMRLCESESIFASREIKAAQIERITLANNELTNVTPILDLARAFPDIRDLDLSNNKFKDLKALEAFRWKFKHLDWLFLSPNPIEIEEPDYEQTIVHWFPTLRRLNTTVVRDNLAAADAAAKDGIPLTTIKDSFHDEGGIAESAIKTLISNMDADRSTLARSLYDDESTFSLSYNASAPRLETTQSTSWEPYLKQSRNLKKVTNLEPRIRRMAKGINEIESALKILPPTRHPDLVNDSLRYSFDCTPIPGVPDPLGRIESGVGGFKVDIHGQFEEMSLATGQWNATRSFDRVFILGPGLGENQLRIVSDILILRAEGGYEAFNPGNKIMPELPMVTTNFGFPPSGKTEEQIKQAFVAAEVQKVTGLTMEYAIICLKESDWNFQTALEKFNVAKSNGFLRNFQFLPEVLTAAAKENRDGVYW